MFKKILIANRGEIACRVARTAKRMGIKTVAIYSEADANALHVHCCDESVPLGGNTAVDSYLNIEKVIAAAISSGAEAVHPGYGFLSENAVFAERCEAENRVFIGPSVDSIKTMGSKSLARQIMLKSGVPVLPGYDGEDQALNTLKNHAGKIGYPLLIKAVSGGGGKGMRIVKNADTFLPSLESVKREGLSAFADDRVLLEQFLPVARHIEVQIFADSHGNVVHLFERDCSMQRRHQKVIEESPAPGMDTDSRGRITDAAIKCAQSIHYLGAGTVEFLFTSNGSFYFMEMNTRLQVEHPVTEMISGQDLVEWQLAVAAGKALPCGQNEININGHAIESRIYAENPENGFLPATGEILYMDQGDTTRQIRVDTGIKTGDLINPYYDPMLSKLVIRADSRDEALTLMSSRLREMVILGLKTNIEFLHRIIENPVFVEAKLETGFIDANTDRLTARSPAANLIYAFACAYLYLRDIAEQKNEQKNTDEKHSPWVDGQFHLTDTPSYCSFILEGLEIPFSYQQEVFFFSQWGVDFEATLSDINRMQVNPGIRFKARQSETECVTCGSVITAVKNQTAVFLHVDGKHYHFSISDPFQGNSSVADDNGDASGIIRSPMPGMIIAIKVKKDTSVNKGEVLMVIEAMKMEHQIRAPINGKVKSVHFHPGDQVEEGEPLIQIEAG